MSIVSISMTTVAPPWPWMAFSIALGLRFLVGVGGLEATSQTDVAAVAIAWPLLVTVWTDGRLVGYLPLVLIEDRHPEWCRSTGNAGRLGMVVRWHDVAVTERAIGVDVSRAIPWWRLIWQVPKRWWEG